MNLRFADEHDAAACLAIYAQYIDTSITFETALPSEDEFAGRIRSYGAVYPWLIAEEEGKILAYAYAHRAQERAAYDWNAELSVYVSKNAAGRGLGTRLYRALLALLKEQGVRTAYGVVTMPNDASAALHRKLGFGLLGTYHTIPATKTAAGAMWSGSKSTSARLTACRSRSAPSASSQTAKRSCGRFEKQPPVQHRRLFFAGLLSAVTASPDRLPAFAAADGAEAG